MSKLGLGTVLAHVKNQPTETIEKPRMVSMKGIKGHLLQCTLKGHLLMLGNWHLGIGLGTLGDVQPHMAASV